MESRSELEQVRPRHFREVLRHLERVIGLLESSGIHAEGEVVKGNVFGAFDLRSQRVDGGIPGAIHETLGREAGTHTSLRLAYIVGVPEITQAEFVDHGWPEDLGQAQAHQLCSAQGGGIEARNTGAALRRGVGIVEAVVIKEVVSGKSSQAGITVDARPALVVAQGFIVRGRRKGTGSLIGRGESSAARSWPGPTMR